MFGIGIESYTVGSHEFYMNYAAQNQLLCLLDSGHYHPTEMISDKISSMLLFSDELALHISRPVRWDSDHVVLYDDETRQIAQEITAMTSAGSASQPIILTPASTGSRRGQSACAVSAKRCSTPC